MLKSFKLAYLLPHSMTKGIIRVKRFKQNE